MRSIIQNKKECYITGCTFNLHEHHVYGGARRKNSEKYGLKIWLRSDWHNLADYGVHNDTKLDKEIKSAVQKIAMEHYNWTVDDFICLFGKNYLKE